MADAESPHESGRWEVKRIKGEDGRFQWGQVGGNFASKGRDVLESPHETNHTDTHVAVQAPTHSNMLLHAHAEAYTNTHSIYLDS